MLRTLSIPQQFEQIAARMPNAVAVSGDGAAMTYDGLNRAANRLARLIAHHELAPESAVAFHIPRGPRQIIVMLAILKAGAAYLPLDPSYPLERLRFMLHDSDCPLIVTSGASPAALLWGRAHIDFDCITDLPEADGNLGPVDCRALAYVIYTSGSTGQPKGVLVEHRGVVLLAGAQSRFLKRYGAARHYQFFSLAFDGSVSEIFLSLLGGIELVIDSAGPSRLEPDELLDMLDADRVDCLMTTPSFLARATLRARPNLKTITLCGETCAPDLARNWSRLHRLINAYGPTEATVCATMGEIEPADSTVSIGRPLPHMDVLLLDEHGFPVADGEIGEIYLAGPAVARGYLRRREITAAAFLLNPFSTRGEPRMYRTGDLGRRLPDGRFDFLGRVDDQIKLRGFRVEPAEIEARLTAITEVSEAFVVSVGEEADKFLVAFLRSEGDIEVEEIRRLLRQQLPAHLVPQFFSVVRDLPRLPNGKTDRKALHDRAAENFRRAPIEPNPAISDVITALWLEALGRKEVCDTDDFFALGGQSVAAGRIVSGTRETLGVNIPLRMLFDNPTLGAYRVAVQQAVDDASRRTPPNTLGLFRAI